MPVRKRQRRGIVTADEAATLLTTGNLEHATNNGTEIISNSSNSEEVKIMVKLVNESGEGVATQLLLPVTATPAQLDSLLSSLLEDELDKRIPYAFFIHGEQVHESVKANLFKAQQDLFVNQRLKEGRRVRPKDVEALAFVPPEEDVVEIMYKPQAIFRVRPVTRCAGTLDGHSEAVLIVQFSPDSEVLATGGGDGFVRIWDIHTLTPTETLKMHDSWVQVLSWSPDGQYLTSGSKDGTLIIWTHNTEYTQFKGKKQKAHSKYVSSISWEPLHRNINCDRYVSASKDTSVRVWKVNGGMQFTLSGHQSCVTCVKWGGEDKIYTASQDRTIIVWSAINGAAKCTLRGHAHWINHLALSTDLILRTGAFDHEEHHFATREEMQAHAQFRYDTVMQRLRKIILKNNNIISNGGGVANTSEGAMERLVSCSDDNTMILWSPEETTTMLSRLTGHQGIIFHMEFSPDGTLLASCSADKSIKLWNAVNGQFITTFRGHVAAVYHVSWSLDSRLIASGSKDTTLKLWSVDKRVLVEDLTGHSDEIYSTDWSPDGQRVATGSKDKQVRVWLH